MSVALFISGIGFVIASGRTPREAPREAASPVTTPVASIKQVMNGITMPNAKHLYDAVGTIVNMEGIKEIEPRTDEEWAALADSATALIESGNLLLMGNRVLDDGDWVAMTRSMMDAGRKALAAVEAKDKEAVMASAGGLNNTCDTCHAKYQRQ